MSAVVLAALMWAVVACCAFPLRRGRDRSVLVAAALMAASFTVTIEAVYLAVDDLLGVPNVADLVKHTLFVAAVAVLGHGLTKAVGGSVLPRAAAWIAPAVVIVVQTATFAAIDMHHGTTTSFMTTYGHQPEAAVYSMVHFAYFGATMGATGVACLRSGLSSAPTVVRTGVRFLLAGCAASVLTALALVVRDVTALTGPAPLSDALQRAYAPMLLLSVLLVALGLGLPPLMAGATRRRLARELPALTTRLARLRDRASGRSGSLRFPSDVRMPGDEPTPLDELHRLVVEVRDQMFLDPGFEPTPDELAALTRSERLVGRLELL